MQGENTEDRSDYRSEEVNNGKMLGFVLLVAVAFSSIAILELPLLIRERKLRETIVFSVLWLSGLTLSLVQVFGAEPPNPTRFIEILFGGPR